MEKETEDRKKVTGKKFSDILKSRWKNVWWGLWMRIAESIMENVLLT